MKRMMLVAVVAAVVLLAGQAGAQSSRAYVGAPDLIGPVAFVDWHVGVDMTSRVVTVTGVVQNRSDVTLTDVVIGIGDEETAEVAAVPATLAPGEYGTFRVALHTGTNLTVRGYALANPVPVVRFVPWAEQ
jgi:hypothetical protein